MIVKELLELAAKAAGMKDMRYASPFVGMVKMLDPTRPETCGSIGPDWNPLEDDGDAFRLAVELRITFRYNETLRQAFAWRIGGVNRMEFQVNLEDCCGDEVRAVRYVIVRAAAEIGRNMK